MGYHLREELDWQPDLSGIRWVIPLRRFPVTRAHYFLSAWNGQHGHDLDRIARENGKMRVLIE